MPKLAILVPLDGSRFGEAALPIALELARALDGEVELVSVYDDEPMVGGWSLSPERVKQWFHEYLADVAGRAGAGAQVPITTQLVAGPVAERLEERAAQDGADLIVMATHGRGPLSRAWLGSVADHIVRHVTIPVLLVRPDEEGDGELPAAPPVNRVLVALDGSSRAEQTLDWVTRIARGHGAAVTLVRVVPPHYAPSPYLPHAITESRQARERERADAGAYLENVAQQFRARRLDVDTRIVDGVPAATGILRAAQESGADLIAIGTHGRGGLAKLMLGSVADKVLRGAEVPVLAVRSPAPAPSRARHSARKRR